MWCYGWVKIIGAGTIGCPWIKVHYYVSFSASSGFNWTPPGKPWCEYCNYLY